MGDRGYIVPPKFRTCTPCTSQVTDAAYVKILSKRLQLQDCIRFVQICTPPSTFENVPTRLAAKLGRLVFRSLLNTEHMYSNAAVHGEVHELEFGSVHVL